MKTFLSLLLAIALTLGYFLFFRAQDESVRKAPAEAPKSSPASASAAHEDPYKADLDRARLAAQQMNAEKAEADSIR